MNLLGLAPQGGVFSHFPIAFSNELLDLTETCPALSITLTA